MKYLDPKADLTFKKIFGNHPKRLISLLNALLPLSEEEQIHEIEYLPIQLYRPITVLIMSCCRSQPSAVRFLAVVLPALPRVKATAKR